VRRWGYEDDQMKPPKGLRFPFGGRFALVSFLNQALRIYGLVSPLGCHKKGFFMKLPIRSLQGVSIPFGGFLEFAFPIAKSSRFNTTADFPIEKKEDEHDADQKMREGGSDPLWLALFPPSCPGGGAF
jgi:hypothetical protein